MDINLFGLHLMSECTDLFWGFLRKLFPRQVNLIFISSCSLTTCFHVSWLLLLFLGQYIENHVPLLGKNYSKLLKANP